MTAKKAPAARKLNVIYLGNFSAPHSTENHVARALEHNGHGVARLQEDDPETWAMMTRGDVSPSVNLILWTHTQYPILESAEMLGKQFQMLRRARNDWKIPVVGIHLDIWIGLKRQHLIDSEPFFSSDLVITADGGHDDVWASKGINHHWFPPGVSLGECELGTPRDEYRSPLAFVGSWDGGYHQEHQHRHELVRWLQQNYKRDCAFYPKPGEHAVRGKGLQDLYTSVDVLIGDSCFSGTGLANYWSDRIPETIGRGGFLLHPEVPGLEDHFSTQDHLWTWPAFDWEELGASIERILATPMWRREVATAGREHVMKHHTYEVRVTQLVELLEERNLL